MYASGSKPYGMASSCHYSEVDLKPKTTAPKPARCEPPKTLEKKCNDVVVASLKTEGK